MSSNPNSNARMYYIRKSDNQAYCFSPVPLISETEEHITLIKDGTLSRVATRHQYTFNGTLLPELPALTGVNDNATCIELLDRKSDQLKYALNEDYGNLLIVDSSGYPVLSIYPKVTSIDFPESRMVTKRDYSIGFEYEEYSTDTCKVSDFSERWDYGRQDDDTISVTHTLSAVGISELPAGTGALENAKNFVLGRGNSLDSTKSFFLKSPYVTDSSLDLSNLTAYNHSRQETSDEVQGSYDIQETWILASGAYKDDRTIERSYALDEYGSLVETITVNGTVQGYGDNTFARYDNAVDGFTNFVIPQIDFNAASGISQKTRSDNRFSGTVTYSITYEPQQDSPLENRTINRSFQVNEDGSVSQTVSTSASVLLSSASGIEAAINFCFENNYPIDSAIPPFTASLSGNVETYSVERDEINKSFSLSRTFRDQNTLGYREEYQVSREESAENAITVISVNGTVYGLAAESGTKTEVRFNAASGAFYGTIEALIRPRALDITPSGTCIGSRPITKTVGYNKFNGIITYDYRYDSRFLTNNENILDENIEVNYSLPADVIANIPIPGKSTGPILQDQETTTAPSKSIRINYRMKPSGDTCGPVDTTVQYELEQAALTESDILIDNTRLQNSRGEKPVATRVFKTADNYTFDRRGLIFNRNVTWEYTTT